MSLWMSRRLTTAVSTAVFALALSALAACASFATRLAAPKVTVESISVGGIQGADAIVTLSLRVENPNAIELMVESLQFGLSINDIALTRGGTPQGETVAADGYAVIQLETRPNMKAVLQ